MSEENCHLSGFQLGLS